MNFEDFLQPLQKYKREGILFVALGNELRGDDSASFYFIDKLQEDKDFSKSTYLIAGTNPENYLAKILNHNPEVIILIDAARFGGYKGEISWLNKEKINNINISTHAFSIKLVEDFLLSEKHIDFKYLGIEPFQTDFGQSVSSEMIKSINEFFHRF